MLKFVLDADGAIKLATSDSLASLAAHAKCFITGEVLQEILKGKEKMFEDAFVIEQLVQKEKIIVIETVHLRQRSGFGKGECSARQAFMDVKADAIITDDAKFINWLEEESIPFIVPAHALILLTRKYHQDKELALIWLEAMKRRINEDVYADTKKMLRGEYHGNNPVPVKNT